MRRARVVSAVFQCFGVEPTLRKARGLLPPKPRIKLEQTLNVLDRTSNASPPRAFVYKAR